MSIPEGGKIASRADGALAMTGYAPRALRLYGECCQP
jgi:hypothetical protein